MTDTTPTNEERMLAFLESLDMDGFKRAPLEDPVDEAFALVQDALRDEEE